MSAVIKVSNLSKQYRLGQVGTGTISHDVNRWWHKVRGKEDPYIKIGESNDRTVKGDSDYVWALKDINFEVQQGEVLGIIGRNGAGKSTLLKILSRTTSPSTGSVKLKGRVASLLEVGTGFHPELSGRDNIYLNGAILGMTRHEIKRKFDEIVDFAGVERYIDTPVKRYSSGMYVRLAFGVAAHLESEILIVDEVLAVGDAEFQKKCLGKMKEVSEGQGRTVLVVSHQMALIENLAKHTILLKNGNYTSYGTTSHIISEYLQGNNASQLILSEIDSRKGNRNLFFMSGYVESISNENNEISTFSTIRLRLYYKLSPIEIKQFRIDVGMNNGYGERIAWMSTETVNSEFQISNEFIDFVIYDFPFAPGVYTFNLYSLINFEVADWLDSVMPITVMEKDYYKTGKILPPGQGSVLLNYKIV